MGVQNQQVPLFALPVILLCIFVSFLTVALALRKPMKIVSRISPSEATRYLENAETPVSYTHLDVYKRQQEW